MHNNFNVDELNSLLQIEAEQEHDLVIQAAYSEFLQEMFRKCYSD